MNRRPTLTVAFNTGLPPLGLAEPKEPSLPRSATRQSVWQSPSGYSRDDLGPCAPLQLPESGHYCPRSVLSDSSDSCSLRRRRAASFQEQVAHASPARCAHRRGVSRELAQQPPALPGRRATARPGRLKCRAQTTLACRCTGSLSRLVSRRGRQTPRKCLPLLREEPRPCVARLGPHDARLLDERRRSEVVHFPRQPASHRPRDDPGPAHGVLSAALLGHHRLPVAG